MRLLNVLLRWTCVSFLHGNEVLRLVARRPGTLTNNVNFCRKVFVNSRYTLEKARSVAPFTNLVLLHPGIHCSEFSEKSSVDIRSNNNWNNRKIILMLSRLNPRKGYGVVLKALGRIVGKHPEVLLLIGGEGAYRSQIENQVRMAGLQQNVVFVGFVPENEKSAYYRASDVYCMPSDMDERSFDVEGFGITFLEAAAAGTLAIGSRTGGIPDAVEDGKAGLLIDQNDDVQLAALLDNVFSNPLEYAEIRAYARNRVFAEFDWSRQVDKILSALQIQEVTRIAK